MKKIGIIFLPHANIQYSQLEPANRGWVIKRSYEKILDIATELEVKMGFEASGKTIEIMAEETPDVLRKLRTCIKNGTIEPVASPNSHIMLSNVSPEIGYYSLVMGLDTWEKYTGVRPVVGWNPECGWAYFIPDIFKKAGFRFLIMDWDSYILSTVPGLREKVGIKLDVSSHSNKNLLFKIYNHIKDRPEILKTLYKPSEITSGLYAIFRTDMLCNQMLWYLMGTPEEKRDRDVTPGEIRSSLLMWKEKIKDGDGFLMPYAEDAEYVGTTAYFYVKQFGIARFFEEAPESVKRFVDLIKLAKELEFEFIFPTETVKRYGVIKGLPFNKIERGSAWHGGTAKAWENTIYSRILDPVCDDIFEGIMTITKYLKLKTPMDDRVLKKALEYTIDGYVSDSRWPPAPTSPGRFNVCEAINALVSANKELARVMKKHRIGKSLYSPDLIKTQIEFIKNELMGMSYFGEK